MKPKRVIVAPLDWGLGHATRCIPIIQELVVNSCEVLLAGSGHALLLLRKEFPTLAFVELPAYNPVYPRHGSMVIKMLFQLPKFIKTIKAEHGIINKIVADKEVDIIISDNRYGCWSSTVTSIFITHQLNILMPKGWGWLAKVVNYFNYRQIKRFSSCWVPDYVGEKSLSGELSVANEIYVKHIGSLSRFNSKCGDSLEKQFDVLILLSGPEPQRTMLEKLLVTQLSNTQLRTMLIRGIPGGSTLTIKNNIHTFDFLDGDDLKQAICKAKVVISRSGYSTLMDLMVLEKCAIFIPTPNQSEQLYMAERMKIKRIAYFAHQFEFEINTALHNAKDYSGFFAVDNDRLLKDAIKDLVD